MISIFDNSLRKFLKKTFKSLIRNRYYNYTKIIFKNHIFLNCTLMINLLKKKNDMYYADLYNVSNFWNGFIFNFFLQNTSK